MSAPRLLRTRPETLGYYHMSLRDGFLVRILLPAHSIVVSKLRPYTIIACPSGTFLFFRASVTIARGLIAGEAQKRKVFKGAYWSLQRDFETFHFPSLS